MSVHRLTATERATAYAKNLPAPVPSIEPAAVKPKRARRAVPKVVRAPARKPAPAPRLKAKAVKAKAKAKAAKVTKTRSSRKK